MIRAQISSLTLLLTLFIDFGAFAQTIPVGSPLEDVYRREQLTGKFDSTLSFTIRPLSVKLFAKQSTGFYPEQDSSVSGSRLDYRSKKGNLAFTVLPISWQQQFNSTLPYGWNDGAMIPAKGYQTKISAGVYLEAGPLSIQLQPEYVNAENRDFQNEQFFDEYALQADIPVRFGEDSYSKVLWGQSSILLNAGHASIGISSQNLWWGPGMRNSLLMSNTGKGFKHLTLHTNRPVNTIIGAFEAQVIAAKLNSSPYGRFASNPSYTDWRYLTSMTFSYQPRWVPGLFVGLTRSFQVYSKNINGLKGYFPFFTPFIKVNDTDNVTGSDNKDQLASIFVRWLLTTAHAELYFEYGTSDHSYNLRDFLMSPQHSRAYIFGFRKLTPLNSSNNQFIQVNAEVTQLSQTTDWLVRKAMPWYMHGEVRHGYTNEGEILGAGIGPGSNLQSIDVSWVKGKKLIGIQVERYLHNIDFSNSSRKDLNSQSRRWVDLGLAVISTWEIKNLLLNTKIQGIESFNYQWQMKNYSPEVYYIPENDIFNVHAELGLTYLF
ncbi:capsule assembly Wzi family protein [Flavihumibacter sp. R14]|nr:capsule assembly Wzi family protein [Flavihumibacter soli]